MLLPQLKLKKRILLGYLLPICFFICLGTLLFLGAVNREKTAEKVRRSQKAIINAGDVTSGLSKMMQNVRGQILFPLDKKYETNYLLGLQLFREASKKLDQVLQDPAQRQQLVVIITEVNQLDELAQQVFSLVKKGDLAYAKTIAGSLRLTEIDAAQDLLLKKEQEFLFSITQQEQNETSWILLLILVGTGLSAISSFTIGLWIASDIGQMMNQAADAIATSSREIGATVELQECTASQQAIAVNQTTITMDELGASSKATVQQAESAAAGARQAMALTEKGTEVVERTLEGMATLKEKVEAIATQILYLNEQTNQIGTISGLVSEFANQTNMLALNAAVEAVRAGDQGKGFTVIASEIRQLADRSKTSAEKINSLVADIQAAISSTVKVTDAGTKTVDAGMQLTQGTAAAFSGVSDAINSIALSTQQISLTAQQQALAIEQVVDAMKTLTQGAEATAIGISQAKAGTEKLNAASHNLKAVL